MRHGRLHRRHQILGAPGLNRSFDAQSAGLHLGRQAGTRILYGTLAVGRCWSADQLALSANRNIGFCMGMGQVAGMVAAMAVQSDTDIRSIDVKALQKAVYPLKAA